ncbi:MAG TPA: S8 family serine peptidase [Acidimicrobiia bacterium]|nr:S8 family serine peptidase [Acidimicrobiia bacterium]
MALSLGGLATISRADGEVTPLFGRYIVVLEDSAAPASVAESAAGLGATVNGLLGSINGLVATLPVLNLAALESDPRVAYVTPDRPVKLMAEPAPSGISRIGAGPRFDAAGAPVAGPEPKAAVAILDTGISSHPELNVVGGVNCASDPLGGLLGGLLGGGARDPDEGGDFTDGNGHGSHVAGTVAARSDGQGVVGVSPGTPLYAVRVFSSLGTGALSDVICGLDWVAANAAAKNIKVVNMSLGGSGVDDKACGTKSKDPFHEAVCRVTAAGVTVVVAAGNSNVDLTKTVPASYDEVLTVAAMADFDGVAGGLSQSTCDTKDQDDTAADFSNFAMGEDAAHMVTAPGVCITSTWNDGAHKTISGTSMASPHVAGLVARCIDAGPCAGLGPAQIIEKIRADAAARPAESGYFGDPNRPVESRFYGYLIDSSTF